MELKELVVEFQKAWSEIRDMLEEQQEEIKTHTAVLETLIREMQ